MTKRKIETGISQGALCVEIYTARYLVQNAKE